MKNKIMIMLSVFFEFLGEKLGLIQFEGEPDNIEISVNDSVFKIPKSDFAKAIEQNKLSIKDENYLIFAKPDYEIRTKNQDALKYNEGKTAGVEMLAKDIKKKFSMDDIEGKDFNILFETYAERKIKEANVPVDKKVQEHEKTIGELRNNLTMFQTENEKLKNEKEQIANDFKQKEYQLEINNTLNLLVPEKAITDSLSRKDIIALFRANGFDAKMVDNKIVAVKDGEIVKHPVTLEPEPLNKVLNDFVNVKKLIPIEGGRGGGDNTGADTAGSWDSFVKEMDGKGIKPGSEKFGNEQRARQKNGTLKI